MARLWWTCGLAGVLAFVGCKQDTTPAVSSQETAAPAPVAEEAVDLGTPAAAPVSAAPAPETPAPASATTSPSSAATPAPAAAAPAGVDWRHVAADGALAVIVRPAQALNNPVVMGVIRAIEESQPNFKLTDRLNEMRQELGIDVNDIDHVLVVVDQQQLAMAGTFASMMMAPPMSFEEGALEAPPGAFAPPPGPGAAPDAAPAPDPGTNCDDQPLFNETAPPLAGPPGGLEEGLEVPPPLVVVKFNKSVDQQKLADAGGNPAETRTHGGQTYYLKGDKSATWFQDPQTAIISSEPRVQALIDGQWREPGPLAKLLEPLATRELAVALDVTQLHAFVSMMAQQNPVAAMAGGLVKQVNSLTLAADLQGANLLQLQLHTLNEGSAGGLQGMLGGFLQQGQQAFAAQTQAGADSIPPEAKDLLPLIEKLVNGASVTAEGSVCSITVPRPDGIEQLPTLIKPALQKVQTAAAEARELNGLKQIALAFHNYHDIYGAFPAHGGSGSAGRPGQGLSWRVHLLPFLEEAALYNEFNLDEPWDSEHNRALISRMPKIYGENPEGKTSLHVFVGPGGGFEGDEGLRLFDVTDGTSLTILAVQAGPSTADVWTKPGGLTLDAASPLGALGDVGATFPVVLMDGSARKLSSTMDAETFKNLVNPKDGNPVRLD